MKLLTHYPYYAQLGLTVASRALNIVTRKRCSNYDRLAPFFRDKVGLEIGGPSTIFKANHLIPVYDRARAVDSVNFSDKTVWTRGRERDVFGPSLRDTFVCDATEMDSFEDESYDFVLASHVLEHVANPLRALRHWKRVVKRGGVILFVVPHKSRTFDVSRPFTTFEHLVEDFRKDTPETDTTHMEEVVRLHDWRRDAGCTSPEHHRERCMDNATNRCVHHHVYSPELVAKCFEFCGMNTLSVSVEYPYHIVATGVNP